MLKVDRVRTSTKAIGKFEEVLIKRVSDHFRQHGYKVFPHARFTIAWGSSLSDLDILLVKNETLTVIEVKSKRDKITRAGQQMRRISDYIDYGYVATDRLPKHWDDPRVGLLLVGETVETVDKAKRFKGRPTVESLSALQKKCLLRFLGGEPNSHILKYDVAETVRSMGSEESIRRCLKKIVTCREHCETDCPVLRFAVRNGSKPLPSSFSESYF
jgi:hypothetical protein